MFTVQSAGGAARAPIGEPFVAGGAIGSFVPLQDSLHVVFLADREVDERYELYVAPIDGSGVPRELNAPLVSNGDVYRFDPLGLAFLPTPYGAIYPADQDEDEVVELYLAPLVLGKDGTAAGAATPTRTVTRTH